MSVSVRIETPALLKNMLEALAAQYVDLGYSRAIIPNQCKAIETSSTEVYILGCFDLLFRGSELDKQAIIPFTTSFIFTCNKEKHGSFSLEWICSLS